MDRIWCLWHQKEKERMTEMSTAGTQVTVDLLSEIGSKVEVPLRMSMRSL